MALTLMKTCWCLLLVLGLQLLLVAGERDDVDFIELSNKEIKEKLDLLTNEVIQLKKDVREIKERDNNANGSNKTVKATELKILSVRRKRLNDGHVQYTVRYQKGENYSTMRPIWRQFTEYGYTYTRLQETISNEIPNLPSAVDETSTVTQAQNDSHLLLYLVSSKHLLALYLHNDAEDDVTETDVETPILRMSPEKEIVYEPGQDATVSLAYPPVNDMEDPGGFVGNENFQASFALVKPGDSEVRMPFRDEHFVSSRKESKFLERNEMTMIFNTSNTEYSGIIYMNSAKTFENRLVKRIENQKEIILRPSTQKGPFPEGKIYPRFFHSMNDRMNENGNAESFCPYRQKCEQYCSFLGDDLSSLKLYKTVSGKTTEEDFEIFDESKVSYQKEGSYSFTPKEGDVFPVTYTCRATNVNGQSAEIRTDIIFGEEVKILKNLSSVKFFTNGTGKIVCTARGTPLPKMTVQCDYHETEPEVLYKSNDVISVTATCRETHSWSTLQCSAQNRFLSDHYHGDATGAKLWP